MQTMTRRPCRAAITSTGLMPTKRCEVLAGHGYYFGGSSSPSFVLVLAVTAESVTYCDARILEARREQRWIFEDLAARAGETMRKAAAQAAEGAKGADESKAMGRLAVQIAKVTAERVAAHGAPVDPTTLDRVHVKITLQGPGDVYAYADALGGVIVSCDTEAGVAVVETSQGTVNEYVHEVWEQRPPISMDIRVVKACPTV